VSNQIITLLRTRRNELSAISPTRGTWPLIVEWHTRSSLIISQHFGDHAETFSKIMEVEWVTYPRVVFAAGRLADNSKTDFAELVANNTIVANVHKNLLAFLDGLIELYGVCAVEEQQNPESSAIFAEIDRIMASSLLPQQFRNIVAADVCEAQRAYISGANKACVSDAWCGTRRANAWNSSTPGCVGMPCWVTNSSNPRPHDWKS
jgi:hypothetical protein